VRCHDSKLTNIPGKRLDGPTLFGSQASHWGGHTVQQGRQVFRSPCLSVC